MSDERDTGEIPSVSPSDPAQLEALDRLLHELENIRFRLGVLVVWFVVLPILAAIIVWIALAVESG